MPVMGLLYILLQNARANYQDETAIKTYLAEELWFPSVLKSALSGNEWLASCSDRFTPVEEQITT
jgi:hypothetical protein